MLGLQKSAAELPTNGPTTPPQLVNMATTPPTSPSSFTSTPAATQTAITSLSPSIQGSEHPNASPAAASTTLSPASSTDSVPHLPGAPCTMPPHPRARDADAKSHALKALAGVSRVVSRSRQVDAEALQAIKAQRAKIKAEGGPAPSPGPNHRHSRTLSTESLPSIQELTGTSLPSSNNLPTGRPQHRRSQSGIPLTTSSPPPSMLLTQNWSDLLAGRSLKELLALQAAVEMEIKKHLSGAVPQQQQQQQQSDALLSAQYAAALLAAQQQQQQKSHLAAASLQFHDAASHLSSNPPSERPTSPYFHSIDSRHYRSLSGSNTAITTNSTNSMLPLRSTSPFSHRDSANTAMSAGLSMSTDYNSYSLHHQTPVSPRHTAASFDSLLSTLGSSGGNGTNKRATSGSTSPYYQPSTSNTTPVLGTTPEFSFLSEYKSSSSSGYAGSLLPSTLSGFHTSSLPCHNSATNNQQQQHPLLAGQHSQHQQKSTGELPSLFDGLSLGGLGDTW